MKEGALRRGDIVEVKDAAEVLHSLDASGALDSMPFMPEMIPYLGRRFTVAVRSEKICDTVNTTLRSRHLPDTVLLDDLRCDGSAHGRCQAECRIYWKEAWLRRVDSLDVPRAHRNLPSSRSCSPARRPRPCKPRQSARRSATAARRPRPPTRRRSCRTSIRGRTSAS